MAYEAIEFEIAGVAPLIMHNVRLANPLDPLVKEMKKITGKKKKMDDDYETLANMEFEGGLYLNSHGSPCIPGENIAAMMIEAAKRSKLGKDFKAGVFVDGDWPVIYKGPNKLSGLSKKADFRLAKMMTVAKSKILRTRPIFRSWRLKFTLHFHPGVVNRQAVVDAVAVAGELIGIGDSRPMYGRFDVV